MGLLSLDGMDTKRYKFLAIFFAALLLSAASGPADAQVSREYEIKAAFLYNFIKLIEWPPEVLPKSSPTITMCVLGEDPFGETMDSIADKSVKGKKLLIRRVPNAAAAEHCNVLFISSSEQERLTAILNAIKRPGVLTVGETDRFVEQGGIINLVVDRNKIRFEVNMDGAEQAGLQISSKLLNLARAVKGKTRES